MDSNTTLEQGYVLVLPRRETGLAGTKKSRIRLTGLPLAAFPIGRSATLRIWTLIEQPDEIGY